MAKTFAKTTIHVFTPNNAILESVVVYLPEAASVSGLAGTPLVWASGYIDETTAPCESLVAFAMEDGHNSTPAGTDILKVLPAAPGSFIHLHGNLLSTAAADNVLAATDLGAKVQLDFDATAGADGGPIWFLGDSASNAGLKIVSFECDPQAIPQAQDSLKAVAGDTNARVTAVLLDSAADWAA